MRSPVNHALPFVLIAAILGGTGAEAKDRPSPPPVSGPAADYPVVVGAPFQVQGTTWTPEDRLNYDAVGYAAVDADGSAAVSGAHKTLPLPSYAEVTSLESGRTILVRIERRGPMRNDKLIELSPGAAAQLGLAGSANPPVRVRRVNPPEQERAMLRTGGRAPERMATPKGLLDALNRKLATSAPAAPAAAPAPKTTPAAAAAAVGRPADAPKVAAPRLRAPPARQPAPVAPKPKAAAAPAQSGRGSLVVQVAALSSEASARALSGRLGGGVSSSGRFWRVRLGPFATRAQAEAALASAVPSIADVPVAAPDSLPPPPEVAKMPVALLIDVNSGRTLYAQAPERRFAPASMAKVMTVYVALEEMKAGRLSLSRKMAVPDAIAREWNGKGTSLYLRGGQEIDVDTLLRGIATVSANDASVVLAEGHAGDVARWCALMNGHARKLGMGDSHFATPNGWPDGGQTYVSARDLVILAKALVTRHPEAYRRYFGQKRMTFAGVEQQSHDPTVGVVRGADGIKTGHTREAGYNFLGSAERGGQRLVMVVGGAASEADRAAASRGLLEWGFSAWRPRVLFPRGAKIAEVRVQNGQARSVSLVADQVLSTIDPKGQAASRPKVRLLYEGPIVAPIAKGAQVAEIEIASADRSVQRFPLYAAASVGTAGPLDRLVNGLVGLFT